MDSLIKEALYIAIDNWHYERDYDKANEALKLIEREEASE